MKEYKVIFKRDKNIEQFIRSYDGKLNLNFLPDGTYTIEARNVFEASTIEIMGADLYRTRVITPEGIEYNLAFLDKISKIAMGWPRQPLVWWDTNISPMEYNEQWGFYDLEYLRG